ncbi:MAG TPA: hypothetical protein DCX21_01635 [Eubacterium sp.]|nr:hypothetical protein [Eubacterium sp.]
MRCCNCGEKIIDFDRCPKCKEDVSGYKILKRASDIYYNQGLMKARVRDLSGAIISLRLAICCDKDNIEARNLLGLVYYEIGEVVYACREWVISKNYKPKGNLADTYLKKMQSGQNKLDAMNNTIKKFNRCLEYVHNNNYDVARIQLKRITQVNPKFVKAGLLLSLLYMRKGEYEKAKKLLNRLLNVDKGNTQAYTYLSECEARLLEKKKEIDHDYTRNSLELIKKKEKDVEEKKPLSGNDVIVPKSTYKEPSNGAITVINVLLGVAIGAAIMWFLIVPSMKAGLKEDNNKQVKSYVEQMSSDKAEIARLTQALKDAIEVNDSLKSGTSTNSTELENIKALLQANEMIKDGDITGGVELLSQFGSDQLVDENAKKLYDRLLGNNFLDAYNEYMNRGKQAAEGGDNDAAAKAYAMAYKINPTQESASGAEESYRAAGNEAEATKYQEILKNY